MIALLYLVGSLLGIAFWDVIEL